MHGGPLELGKKCADSILLRMRLVKRKATKAARKTPPNFADIKLTCVQRVAEIVHESKVPPELVINWDQTGAKFVPASQWMLAEQGVKQVNITGLDDKREMTAILACTLYGSLLPSQLIYAGKKTRCHPVIDFPAGWDIWHSDNHWSTEVTMLRYIDIVIILLHTLRPLDSHFVCRLTNVLGKFSMSSLHIAVNRFWRH